VSDDKQKFRYTARYGSVRIKDDAVSYRIYKDGKVIETCTSNCRPVKKKSRIKHYSSRALAYILHYGWKYKAGIITSILLFNFVVYVVGAK